MYVADPAPLPFEELVVGMVLWLPENAHKKDPETYRRSGLQYGALDHPFVIVAIPGWGNQRFVHGVVVRMSLSLRNERAEYVTRQPEHTMSDTIFQSLTLTQIMQQQDSASVVLVRCLTAMPTCSISMTLQRWSSIPT